MSLKIFSRFLSALARPALLVLTGLALFALGGCLFVTDTTLTDPDVFAAQTAPVWDRPAVERPLPQRPAGLGNLYQTQFHQTYGMQAPANPVSNMASR
ncbi:hypothetical protein FB480_10983 [Agrobacterium vitis]|nr:hypothetical protein FB480_10983 [Agrobacterium vitis]